MQLVERQPRSVQCFRRWHTGLDERIHHHRQLGRGVHPFGEADGHFPALARQRCAELLGSFRDIVYRAILRQASRNMISPVYNARPARPPTIAPLKRMNCRSLPTLVSINLTS
jgi:hypothetical protein